MTSRIVYTKAALKELFEDMQASSISDERRKKFAVIEDDPVATKKSFSRDTDVSHDVFQTASRSEPGKGPTKDEVKSRFPNPRAAAGNGAGGRGRGNDGGAGNDRFARPAGRSHRGNRNAETFDEGFKYELEQNAMQQRKLNDALKRDGESAEIRRQLQTLQLSEPQSQVIMKLGSDESKPDLGVPIHDFGANPRRSNFFQGNTNAQAPQQQQQDDSHHSKAWSTAPHSGGGGAPLQQQQQPFMMENRMWHPSSNIVNGNANVSAGAMTNAFGTNPAVVNVANMPHAGLMAQQQQQQQQQQVLRNSPPQQPQSQPPQRAATSWNAEDLEKALLSGRPDAARSTPPATVRQTVNAADLESMLLGRKPTPVAPAPQAMPAPPPGMVMGGQPPGSFGAMGQPPVAAMPNFNGPRPTMGGAPPMFSVAGQPRPNFVPPNAAMMAAPNGGHPFVPANMNHGGVNSVPMGVMGGGMAFAAGSTPPRFTTAPQQAPPMMFNPNAPNGFMAMPNGGNFMFAPQPQLQQPPPPTQSQNRM